MNNYLLVLVVSLTTPSCFLERIPGRCITLVSSWCFLFLLFCLNSNLSSILTGYLACMLSCFSHIQLCVTLGIAACRARLSIEILEWFTMTSSRGSSPPKDGI